MASCAKRNARATRRAAWATTWPSRRWRKATSKRYRRPRSRRWCRFARIACGPSGRIGGRRAGRSRLGITANCRRGWGDRWPPRRGGREAGATFEIEHHSELLARLADRLPSAAAGAARETVAYHDPCYLGRYREKYDEPRAVIAQTATVVEVARARERSFCCGAGGGQMFLGEEKGKRVNIERVEELVATGAQVIGTACPFCQTMFRDALGTVTQAPPKLLDIAQIAAASLGPEQ